MHLNAETAAGLSAFLTYEPFYELTEKPFSLASDPAFFYKSAAHRAAFDALGAGIRRREGLIVLSGEIGTGKTTLCRAVLSQLDRKTFSTFVPDPFVTREDLLKMLLIGFGVASVADINGGRLQAASRQDLSYPLYEFLDSLVPLQAFAVLVIDEAQNLSLGVMEEIRILAELEKREKLLQVVLVGQPELRDHLRLPQMRQVEQRVTVRCELSPLACRRRHRIRQPPPCRRRGTPRRRGLHGRGARGRVSRLRRGPPPHQSGVRPRPAARLRRAAEDHRSRHGHRGRARPGPGRTPDDGRGDPGARRAAAALRRQGGHGRSVPWRGFRTEPPHDVKVTPPATPDAGTGMAAFEPEVARPPAADTPNPLAEFDSEPEGPVGPPEPVRAVPTARAVPSRHRAAYSGPWRARSA